MFTVAAERRAGNLIPERNSGISAQRSAWHALCLETSYRNHVADKPGGVSQLDLGVFTE
jgi:hypothetical protein